MALLAEFWSLTVLEFSGLGIDAINPSDVVGEWPDILKRSGLSIVDVNVAALI